MTPEQKQSATRAIKINRQMRELFDQYVLNTSDAILMARFQGKMTRASMLEAGLKVSRKNIEKMETKLAKIMLTTAVVDQLETELTAISKEADALIKEMRDTADLFRKVEDGAALIAKALETVSKFA